MKKVFAVLLIIMITFGIFSGFKNDDRIRWGDLVHIETMYDTGFYIVYNENTSIVYYYYPGSGYRAPSLSPYQIYKDGAIYGAVWEDEQIKAAPIAMTLTPELITQIMKSGLIG